MATMTLWQLMAHHVHRVTKFMSCNQAILVIARMANCIYTMQILFQ